ncbi:hypothetical protein ABK040_007370 [Willaertia magna]
MKNNSPLQPSSLKSRPPSTSSSNNANNNNLNNNNTNSTLSYTLAVGGSEQISFLTFSTIDNKLTPYNTIYPHTKPINNVKWNHNNKVLISCSEDGYISMNLANGEHLGKLNSKEMLNSVSISTSSRLLCTGGDEKLVKIWDLKKKEVIQTFKGHLDNITCVTFSEGEQYVASSDASGCILIHNIQTNTLSSKLILPTNITTVSAIKYIEYSPFYKNLLVSASDDGSVIVWDTTTGKQYFTFLNQHSAPCTCVHFSKQNSALLASAGLDKNIFFYDIKEKKIVEEIKINYPITCLSYLENGSVMAVGTSNGYVVLFDLRKSTLPIFEIPVERGMLRTMVFQSFEKKKKKSSNNNNSNAIVGNNNNIVNNFSSTTGTVTTNTFNSILEGNSTLQKSKLTSSTSPVSTSEITSTNSSFTPPKKVITTINNNNDNLFSPIRNNYSDNNSLKSIENLPSVEDLKKQVLLQQNENLKPIGNFKTFEPITTKQLSTTTTSSLDNNRLSMYNNFNTFKPSVQDDMALFSPTASKKQKIGNEIVGSNLNIQTTNDENNLNFFGLEDTTSVSNDTRSPISSTISFNQFNKKQNKQQLNSERMEEEDSQLIQQQREEGSSSASTKLISPPLSPILSIGAPSSTTTISATNPQALRLMANNNIENNNNNNNNGTTTTQQQRQNTMLMNEEQMKGFNESIKDSMITIQECLHQDITNMHVDILRQFHMQQEQTYSLIEQLSKQIQSLTEEVKELREENKLLKNLI